MAAEIVAELTHYRTGNTLTFTEAQLVAKWKTGEDRMRLSGRHKITLECWWCEATIKVLTYNFHWLHRPSILGGIGKENILCKRCYNRVDKQRQKLAADRGLKADD